MYKARIKRVSRSFAHTWTPDIDILLRAGIVGTKVGMENSTTCPILTNGGNPTQLDIAPNIITPRHIY